MFATIFAGLLSFGTALFGTGIIGGGKNEQLAELQALVVQQEAEKKKLRITIWVLITLIVVLASILIFRKRK